MTQREGQLVLIASGFGSGVAAGLFWNAALSGVVGGICLLGGLFVLGGSGGVNGSGGKKGFLWIYLWTWLICAGLGIYCGIRGAECGQAELSWAFPVKCRLRMEALIDSLQFKDRTCNALLKAFLTGRRDDLTPELLQTFRSSGASHLLALSGLHLGILYTLLSRIFAIGGGAPRVRKAASTLVILLTGFYTLMTGASPSIVRAFLFISIREFGKILGRDVSLLHCWCLALLLQLSILPDSLTKAGFQLSYLAMLGICLLLPPLQSLFPNGGPVKRIWDLAALSISCQAFTAPLSWKLFHSFPKYFLITNLLAMPQMTVLMTVAVVCLTLSALDICPNFILQLTETCCRLLIRTLEIVCEL